MSTWEITIAGYCRHSITVEAETVGKAIDKAKKIADSTPPTRDDREWDVWEVDEDE